MPEFITRSESKAQVQVRTPSVYDHRVEVRLGRIEAHSPLTLGELVLHQGGSVETESGGSITLINSHVLMTGGKLTGPIGNLDSIEKVGPGAGEIVDVANFDGRIEVAGGSLALRNVTGSGTARVTQRGAWLGGGGTTSLAVDLTEVTGNFDTPSLKGISISGEVNLGSVGGFVESATLMGPIVGGDLKADGVAITSNQAAYTGATRVHNSGLTLSHQGRLTTTSEIIIRDGVLHLDNRGVDVPGQPPYAESDRVADHIPITLQGGIIAFAPPQPPITERLGNVTLDRGESRIDTYPPAGGDLSELRLTTLPRNSGAVLEVEIEEGIELYVDTPPVLSNDLIGGWATVKRGQYIDFATYGSTGVRAFTNVHREISTATAAHNVALKVNTVLPAGITAVNSLTMRSDSGAQIDLDLGDQTLAVESGGLNVFGSLSNGAITSGSGSNELIFVGFVAEIDATIVDSDYGPTGITVSGGAYLNSANTFTGPVIVNNTGTLDANHFDAIPDGADLRIDGGSLRTKWTESDVKSLGNLWLRDGGTIGTGGTGGNRFVEFDNIFLESGTIDRVDLVGELNIQKVTDGTVTISNQRWQLPLGMSRQGTIDVYEGTLELNGFDTLIGFRNVPITVHGGRLSVVGSTSSSTPGAPITLAGGELMLRGRVDTVINVTSSSRLSGNEGGPEGFVGPLSGNGDLAIGGRVYMEAASPNFSGATTIEGNVELRNVAALGTGVTTVTRNGSLGLAQATPFTNDVVLAGGELASRSASGLVQVVATGDISVASDSSLTTDPNTPLVIDGELYLTHGVRLFTRGAGRKRIEGELVLGGETTIDVRAGYADQAGNTQERDVVNGLHLTGLISTGATNSSLNILRSGIDEVVLNPSLHAHQGQTLSIRQEGELLPIAIDGPDKVVSGNGTIANSLALSGGATIAPGASPGVLTIDGDVSLGPGSKLAIEVGGTTPGIDYDSLIVVGDLDLSGAILELQFVNDFVPEVGQTFELLQAGSLTGMFANATTLYRTAEHAFLASYENGAVRLEATSLPAIAYGDFNSDGLVDAADYVVWRNALGDTGYDLAADANADAVVNGADYTIWKSHFGSQIPAGAIAAPTSVPEPATGLLALGTLAMLSGVSRSRSRHKCC